MIEKQKTIKAGVCDIFISVNDLLNVKVKGISNKKLTRLSLSNKNKNQFNILLIYTILNSIIFTSTLNFCFSKTLNLNIILPHTQKSSLNPAEIFYLKRKYSESSNTINLSLLSNIRMQKKGRDTIIIEILEKNERGDGIFSYNNGLVCSYPIEFVIRYFAKSAGYIVSDIYLPPEYMKTRVKVTLRNINKSFNFYSKEVLNQLKEKFNLKYQISDIYVNEINIMRIPDKFKSNTKKKEGHIRSSDDKITIQNLKFQKIIKLIAQSSNLIIKMDSNFSTEQTYNITIHRKAIKSTENFISFLRNSRFEFNINKSAKERIEIGY